MARMVRQYFVAIRGMGSPPLNASLSRCSSSSVHVLPTFSGSCVSLTVYDDWSDGESFRTSDFVSISSAPSVLRLRQSHWRERRTVDSTCRIIRCHLHADEDVP
jgi:hypothetical protein